MNDRLHAADAAGATLYARNSGGDQIECRGEATFTCRREDGTVRWSHTAKNLVCTLGKNALLDAFFRNLAPASGLFVGLKGTGTAAAADTQASHAGWSELTGYSNGTRPAFTAAAASGGAIGNTGSAATFAITADATIAGLFLSTDSTKGGTSGTLFNAVNFTAGDRPVLNTDTLAVTYTLTV